MKDGTARVLSTIHSAAYRLTGGLVGRRLVNNEMLLLTTTGRRTGVPHTVPLLYLRDGPALIVVASWGGRPYQPDWYLNLQARPEAEVQILRRRLPVRATATDSQERKRLWPAIVAAYDGYERYQARTTRPIPIVLLHPA